MQEMASRGQLLNRAFTSLLVTQFLGAGNDNILKQVLVFMVATGGLWDHNFGREGLGKGGQSIVGLCLTLPFIFLSGYAGQIADRYSKRTVMLGVKLVEIPICLVAALGFYWGELWLAVAGMVLMGVHSSFFGPAKFGVVPELVASRNLSRANGLLNMLSNVAVIVGSLVAGPIADAYYDAKLGVITAPWIPGLAMLVTAGCGVAAILTMPQISAARPDLRFCWNPFQTYITAIVAMSKGPLLTATLAWSTFYMISMIALMILPEYKGILGISYQATSYLLGILGISVAVSSLVCGFISGDHIRPQLIPYGAAGMTCFLLLLGIFPPEYFSVCVLVAGVGLSAGFYVVPLQALLQYLSPAEERGRFMATANALSFLFVSAGAVVHWIASRFMDPNRVHLIAGGIAFVGTLIGFLRLRTILASRGSAIVSPGG
ncbi:MAG: MFS transporter [Planctomycetota bacterium]|nr:MFS transporter [Planctomycetota bacterium]MDA1180058.1 MFS transporter [Planctomycetota bacterium]